MILKISRAICVVASCAIGTMSAAQESSNQVASNTDWAVFTESSPKECWAVSAPKETVNTKDGNPVSVRRGEILLMVFYRPGASVKGHGRGTQTSDKFSLLGFTAAEEAAAKRCAG